MVRAMAPTEIVDFLLHGTRTGKLAFVAADGSARVTPIWFVLDDEAEPGPTGLPDLLFNTGVATAKGRAMRRDPRVTLGGGRAGSSRPSVGDLNGTSPADGGAPVRGAGAAEIRRRSGHSRRN